MTNENQSTKRLFTLYPASPPYTPRYTVAAKTGRAGLHAWATKFLAEQCGKHEPPPEEIEVEGYEGAEGTETASTEYFHDYVEFSWAASSGPGYDDYTQEIVSPVLRPEDTEA